MGRQNTTATRLLAPRANNHEHGVRGHDAPVVTAEKVVIQAKGDGLDCLVRDVVRKT